MHFFATKKGSDFWWLFIFGSVDKDLGFIVNVASVSHPYGPTVEVETECVYYSKGGFPNRL